MDIADNGGGAATESWREEWGEENQMNGDSTRTKKLQHYELAVSPTVQFTLQEFFSAVLLCRIVLSSHPPWLVRYLLYLYCVSDGFGKDFQS